MAVEITVALLSGQAMSLNCSPETPLLDVKMAARDHFQIGFCRFVSASGEVLDPRSTVLDLGEDTHITAILTSVTVYSWPRGPNFFAISSSGFVVPWGTYPTPPKVLQDIRCIQLTGMGYAYAAIRHDGSVVCWGDPEGGGDCREVQGELKEVVAIQSSTDALLRSGQTAPWFAGVTLLAEAIAVKCRANSRGL